MRRGKGAAPDQVVAQLSKLDSEAAIVCLAQSAVEKACPGLCLTTMTEKILDNGRGRILVAEKHLMLASFAMPPPPPCPNSLAQHTKGEGEYGEGPNEL